MFAAFMTAISFLKHEGFHEEREIRVLAMPQPLKAYQEMGREDDLSELPPVKPSFEVGSKRFISFEPQSGASLPIKRVIVGPGPSSSDDLQFADSVFGGAVPVHQSETPFIG